MNSATSSNHIPQEDTIDLKKYLYLVYMKRWVLFSVMAVVMFVDVVYTFKQTPVYRATSLILIERPQSVAAAVPKESIAPTIGDQDYYRTQYEILRSRALLKKVADSLDLKSNKNFPAEAPESLLQSIIVIQGFKNTRLVSVSADYKDPALAANIANALVAAYIEQNVENMLFMSKEVLKAFPEDAREIEKSTLYGQMKDLSREDIVNSLPSVTGSPVIQRLKAERIGIETELANLSRRYKSKHPTIIALNTKLEYINAKIVTETSGILGSLKADLTGRLQLNNIRVVDYAQAPKAPIKPKKMKNIMTGLIFSFLLGVGIIFLMDQLDDAVKDQESVEDRLGLPYLGSFPSLGSSKGLKSDAVVNFADIEKDPGSAEAIRNLRTNLIFSAPKDILKTVLVTSVLPQEGKSFIASYLAFSFAKAGMRTLLIDADVRKPRIHKIFGIDSSPGLVNILVENTSIERAVRKTPYELLYVLPSGSKTPNPLELFGSAKLNELVGELSSKFDKIIIDTPPSFNISDALVISKNSNSSVFVAKYGMVSTDVLRKIKNRFFAIESKIAGVIINFSDIEKSSYYNYKYHHKYYKSYYASDENKENLVSAVKKDKV